MYYLHRGGETTGPFAPGRIGSMIESGEICGDAQVCAHGTEDWIPAFTVVPIKEDPKPKQEKKITAQRIRKSPFVWIAVVFAMLGFGVIVWAVLGRAPSIFAIGGIILILIGLLVDRRRYICGACGNKVEKTSIVCPTCRAVLVKRLPKKKG